MPAIARSHVHRHPLSHSRPSLGKCVQDPSSTRGSLVDRSKKRRREEIASDICEANTITTTPRKRAL